MLKRQSHFRYQELSAILRSQIMTGYIKPGEYLLPENELSHKYEMSRTSIRKALQELLDEGLIVKMAGKGSIVNPELKPLEPDHNQLTILSPYPSYFSEEALPIVTRMFKEKYPYMNLNVVSLPYESGQFLNNLEKAGLRPDLVVVTDRDYQQMNLDDFVDVSGMIGKEHDISSKLITAFSEEDRLFAVPLTYSPIVLLYDRDIFDLYGVPHPDEQWKLEQFLSAAKALTQDVDGDGVTDLYGFGLSSNMIRWIYFVVKNGVEFQADIDTAALTETLEFFRGLLYRDRVSPIYPLHEIGLIDEMFRRQKVAMQLTSLLAIKGLDRKRNGITQIPFGSRHSKMLIANGMMHCANGDNSDNARLFLQFVLDRDVQRQWMDSTDMLSIYRSMNYECWGAETMRALDIVDTGQDEDKFLHEVLSDMSIMSDLEREMNLFWTGTELPSATALKIRQALR